MFTTVAVVLAHGLEDFVGAPIVLATPIVTVGWWRSRLATRPLPDEGRLRLLRVGPASSCRPTVTPEEDASGGTVLVLQVIQISAA